MNPCPSEVTWRLWLDEELSTDERDEWDGHLSGCTTCQQTLDRITTAPDWAWLTGRPPSVKAACAEPTRPTVPGLSVLEPVGRGGHGVVYRALQPGLDRVVAVKFLKHEYAASPHERDRLATEAASLARLRHPNIIQVYTSGDHDGLPYLVMEWADGGDLEARLSGTPLPAERAAALVETLARAVDAAHAAGVVHRDLKPSNILFAGVGGVPTAKIADFGLAKLLDLPAARTPTVAILGTPNYMAPEQVGGAGTVGPSADVYALGAILYELLTGRPPFVADTPFETLTRACEDDPVPPRVLRPRLSKDIDTVCLHCLRKEPTRRYTSTADLADDLRRVIDRVPIRARPASRSERVLVWSRRHPTRVVSMAAICLAVLGAAGSARLVEVEADRAGRLARADGLLACEPDQFASRLDRLTPLRADAAAHLRDARSKLAPDSRGALNADVALLAAGREPLDGLLHRLSAATPDDLLLIRTAVRPFAAEITPAFWATLGAAEGPSSERFRAACVLALLDPDSPRWSGVAPDVAKWLAEENPLLVGRWAEALRPVRTHLFESLAAVAKDPPTPEADRATAAGVVADFAADRPAFLADLLLELDAGPFRTLLPAVKAHAGIVAERIRAELARPAPDGPGEPEKDAHARRQVRAAVALWHLGDTRPLDGFLGLTGGDVRRRYYAVHACANHGVEGRFVASRLGTAADAVARQSLLLALGDYSPRQLSPEQRRDLRPLVERLFHNDPDPGVHSAADWLLRVALGGPAAPPAGAGRPPADPVGGQRWYVTPGGTTMAVISGPVEFDFGSVAGESHSEGEPRSRRRIDHRFALATREVTVAEFARFLAAHPEVLHYPPTPDDRRPDHPARRVTWTAAVAYCRWLCEREGIPEAERPYPPVERITDGVTFPPQFLNRTGYRLPTEEEWEYAARAGTTTPRFYGFDRDLLPRYGWVLTSAGDSCHPVGSLRPNDCGLFDVYGNVWEWTQPAAYAPAAGNPDLWIVSHSPEAWRPTIGPNKDRLVARGGSYLYHAPFVRSAKRYDLAPPGDTTVGFRIARTLPAVDGSRP